MAIPIATGGISQGLLSSYCEIFSMLDFISKSTLSYKANAAFE